MVSSPSSSSARCWSRCWWRWWCRPGPGSSRCCWWRGPSPGPGSPAAPSSPVCRSSPHRTGRPWVSGAAAGGVGASPRPVWPDTQGSARREAGGWCGHWQGTAGDSQGGTTRDSGRTLSGPSRSAAGSSSTASSPGLQSALAYCWSYRARGWDPGCHPGSPYFLLLTGFLLRRWKSLLLVMVGGRAWSYIEESSIWVISSWLD